MDTILIVFLIIIGVLVFFLILYVVYFFFTKPKVNPNIPLVPIVPIPPFIPLVPIVPIPPVIPIVPIVPVVLVNNENPSSSGYGEGINPQIREFICLNTKKYQASIRTGSEVPPEWREIRGWFTNWTRSDAELATVLIIRNCLDIPPHCRFIPSLSVPPLPNPRFGYESNPRTQEIVCDAAKQYLANPIVSILI